MFEKIKEYVQPYGETLGLAVRDLSTGQRFEMNGDKQFASASVIKIPVMWEFYRRVSQGDIDPQQLFTLRDSHKVGSSVYDSGILREMHDGIQLTYQDILRLMIIISDDTATNIMLDLLGMEQITATMKTLGLNHTIVQRRMMDYEKVSRGIDNFTTANDMDTILNLILQKEKLPVGIHDIMLDTLAKQQINTAIPLYMPSHLKIAHKTGSILDYELEHDVGIIFDDQNRPRVAVSAMTQHLKDNRVVIGTIAKMAYEEVVANQ